MPSSIADTAPVINLITEDTTLSTTPFQIVIALPGAGSYELDAVLCVDCGTLTQTRNLGFFLTTGPTRMAWNQIYWRSPSTIPFPLTTFTASAGGFSISMGFNPMRVRYHGCGLLEVSKARSFTIQLTMPAETCTLRAGSFLRASPCVALT
jgi:hypothetical protein